MFSCSKATSRLVAVASSTHGRALSTMTSVKDVLLNLESPTHVEVKGWVKSVRKHKKVSFVQVDDGSCKGGIQVVINTTDLPQNISTGCSVAAQGKLQQHGKAKEIIGDNVSIIGDCSADSYPIQKKFHSLDFLRENLHLRPRTAKFASIFRIRSATSLAIHNYFARKDFVYINTPILTTTDTEGAGEAFRIQNPYSDDEGEDNPLLLTVSGQLHAEIFATALSKVYTFGPTFRAEKSDTSRHLSEFWMLEPEVAFHDLEASIGLATDCIQSIVASLLDKHEDDLMHLLEDDENKTHLDHIVNLSKTSFASLTYDEAIEVLQKSGESFRFPPVWGNALQREHELYLCEQYCKGVPVYILNYPLACKAFYMKQMANRPEVVSCFDLIMPRIGELIGGSEREDNLEMLEERTSHFKGGVDWYVDLRRFGNVPHAGWGMGFERFLLYLCGIDNIRDVVPIPRTADSIKL